MLFISMPKINFFIRNTNVLYCRVSLNGTSSEFSTGEKLDLKFWNQQNQSYANKKSVVNTLIQSLTFKIKSKSALNDYASARELLESMKKKKQTKEPKAYLSELVLAYIESQKPIMKAGTITNHYIKYENLLKYETHRKIKFDMNSSTVCFDLPESELFKEWFVSEKKTFNKTFASRNLEFFRNALRFALKKRLIKPFELELLEVDRDKIKKPVQINKKELENLKNIDLGSKKLNQIKDLYLIQAGTGLSYVDLYSNWTIKQNDLGIILEGVRSKNQQSFFVPLDREIYNILDKYNFELPKYSNQKYNYYLKTVAGLCGITKKLTTHTGRKTFATLQNENGWSIESIAIMLGHNSIKTTESYYINKSINRLENEIRARF